MKALKIILFSIYPILIALLLMFNLNHGNTSSDKTSGESTNIDTAKIIREAERVGNNGALKVTLLWDFEGDIDLHVRQPNGKEIFFHRKNDPGTGGALDVDNTKGGSGAAENIYWSTPPKGVYKVQLVYYGESSHTGKAGSGTCSLVVFQEGKETQTYSVPMSQINEKRNVVTINIQ